MKLGTATSVFFRNTLEDAIPIVARTGYDGIDIWGGRPHVYREDYSINKLLALKALISDHGLEVSSFMPAFYRYPHSLSSPNPRVREDSIEYMRRCLDHAGILEAPVLLIVPDHSLIGQTRQNSINRMIESIDRIARYGVPNNMRLGIEVLHEDETDLVKTPEDALYMIDQLGYECLGAVLDTGAMNLMKRPIAETIAALGDKLLQIHINDNNGLVQQNLIPGEGTFDFVDLIRWLEVSGYDGFLTAELSKEYCQDPESALRTTAERFRSWHK